MGYVDHLIRVGLFQGTRHHATQFSVLIRDIVRNLKYQVTICMF